MKAIRSLIVLAAVAIVTGCTTMADSIAEKGTGPYRIYEKPKSEVWAATVEAVPSVGLKLVTANESSNMILAQRGVTAFSYGENVAIFIENYNGNQSRVEIVSKRAMETNVFAPDWSRSLFAYLDSKLK
ncbi:hypothetical protein [Halopseudomonas salina]|uniref:Lipoprotein n=1 Tax=Halopseudomonas salina TaxID=1323744 RepID=A0ABQ1NUG1_9GAMM|nr:hypothetical protein [Halopseudomonas salina]GGC84283.1 hypothetical protein GCM10007418_00150 [Halopseudomonas salina]